MEIVNIERRIRSPFELGNKEDLSFLAIIEKGVEALKNGDFGAHLNKPFIEATIMLEELSPPKFSILRRKLKEYGGSIQDFNRVRKQIKEKRQGLIRNKEISYDNESAETLEVLKESPNPSVKIPPQYEISSFGVFKKRIRDDGSFSRVQITYQPLIISKSSRNIGTKVEIVGIAFQKGTVWIEIEVERDVISIASKIATLSSKGAPINSNNAPEVIEYLTQFEAFNQTTLPTLLTSSKMGWLGKDPNKSFLLSDQLIQADCREPDGIQFLGSSEGESKFAESIAKEGSFEEWAKLIKSCQDFPRVMVVFYASLAAPMLPILGTANFVLELFGRTSTGKTIALKVAASVWGSPKEDGDNPFLGTWDATKVQIERNLSMLSGIPLILDDTKRDKNKRNISDVIYMVGAGQGKARGNLAGFKLTKTFKTILITSGETACTRFSQDAGAKARTLEIGGRPFEGMGTDAATFVKKLDQELKENYGFAGPMFAKYILNKQDEWKDWKRRKNEIEMELIDKNPSPVASRLASYFATIICTEEQINHAIPEIFNSSNSLYSLWDEIINNASDTNSERAAIQYVMAWANSNNQAFEGREVFDRIPSSGWAGKWEKKQNWTEICFLPNKLRKILEEGTFNADEILTHWKESGIIKTGTKNARTYTRQVRFFTEGTWMICLKRVAIDVMLDDSQPEYTEYKDGRPF